MSILSRQATSASRPSSAAASSSASPRPDAIVRTRAAATSAPAPGATSTAARRSGSARPGADAARGARVWHSHDRGFASNRNDARQAVRRNHPDSAQSRARRLQAANLLGSPARRGRPAPRGGVRVEGLDAADLTSTSSRGPTAGASWAWRRSSTALDEGASGVRDLQRLLHLRGARDPCRLSRGRGLLLGKSSSAPRSRASPSWARRAFSDGDGRPVTVTAMHPGQRCTVASVASHAMYERADPFFEHVWRLVST